MQIEPTSLELKAILVKSGWYPARIMDITQCELFLLEIYPIIPVQVKEILQEFLGLNITYSSHRSDYIYTLTIDPVKSNLDKIDRDYYSKRIGSQVYPIGHFGNHDLLIASEDGAIFVVFDNWVCKYGDNFITALENICILQKCDSV